MSLVKLNEKIEAYVAHTLDKTFRLGIQICGPRPSSSALDAFALQNGIEFLGIRGIVVDEQVHRQMRLLGEIQHGIRGPLRHPSLFRLRRDTREEHPTAVEVQEELDIQVHQPFGGQCLHAEAIAGPQRLGMPLQEVGPRAFATLGSRTKSRFPVRRPART